MTSHLWEEAPPQIGEEVVSHWEMIEESHLINPWRSWLRFTGGRSTDMLDAEPVSLAFISRPGQPLERDREFESYRQKFGWTDERDLIVKGLAPIPDLVLEDLDDNEKDMIKQITETALDPEIGQNIVDGVMRFFLQRRIDSGQVQLPIDPNPVVDDRQLIHAAESIVRHCRSRTFGSFKEAVLGVTLEFNSALWVPKNHQNLNDHDVVPHQDWVRQDVPVAIVVASECYDPYDCDAEPGQQLGTKLWNGGYEYKGDLVDNKGYTMDYLHAVDDMEQVNSPSINRGRRSLWVADGRRGLHGRPTMQPEDEPVVRLFMRVFVAPTERI